jgi:hypothetical protein
MRRFLFVFVVFPIMASAQSQISLYTGTNLPYVWGADLGDVESGDLRGQWFPAINLGGSLQFPLWDWLEVSPGLEYDLYLFRSYKQYTVSSPGILAGSSGHSSYALRLTVDARFIDNASGPTRYYALIGLGYEVKKFGSIDLTWSSPEASTHVEFQNYHGWVQTLGIGIQQSLSEFYSFDISVKGYSNYRNPFDLSLNVGVTYRLSR